MNREELIKEFDKQQLEILLNDLQDIDKFTGFKDGAFKYELGKYQANLLVNCIKKQKEVIDRAIEYINKYAWQEEIISDIYTTTGKPAINRYMQLDWDNCNELLDILKEVNK